MEPRLRQRHADQRPAHPPLAVVDDFTRECLALVVDTSLSGARVARELDAIIAVRGVPPLMIVSDNVLCREAAAGFGQQVSMRRQPSARHAI